jgi:hypothetical protein
MAKQTFTTGQVLTAAQMTSLQQTAMLGGAASAKTASYTLVAADAGTAISMSNASATTITVNTALFAAGDTVQITNLGAGVCTITAGTATVNTSASLALAQYESGTLDFTSTSAAIFIKGAGAAASSGGMTLLSTTTLSGASTVDISGISQDYKELRVYIYGVTSTSGASPFHQVLPYNGATDLGSDTGWRMANYGTPAYGAGAARRITSDDAVNQYCDVANANNFWALTFYDYSSTTNYKQFLYLGNYVNTTSSTNVAWHSFGQVRSNSAIDKLSIQVINGGNFSTGTVEIYGIK